MWRTLHFILLVFIVLAVACIPPLPPPGQIPPPPDAGPPDVFTLFTADCSLQIVADQEADQEEKGDIDHDYDQRAEHDHDYKGNQQIASRV